MGTVEINNLTKEQVISILKEDGLCCHEKYSKLLKVGEKEIGFYTVRFLLGRLTLEYNILEKYRNKGFGYPFVNIVTELVEQQYPEFEKIYLLIHHDNLKSMTVATQNGYVEDYDIEFKNIIDEEMHNYSLFSKMNNNYIKSKQLLHKI